METGGRLPTKWQKLSMVGEKKPWLYKMLEAGPGKHYTAGLGGTTMGGACVLGLACFLVRSAKGPPTAPLLRTNIICVQSNFRWKVRMKYICLLNRGISGLLWSRAAISKRFYVFAVPLRAWRARFWLPVAERHTPTGRERFCQWAQFKDGRRKAALQTKARKERNV